MKHFLQRALLLKIPDITNEKQYLPPLCTFCRHHPKMDYALILSENLESPSPIPWFFKNLKPS